MTLRDFFEQVKDLSPDTPVCVAEADEAALTDVAGVEVVRDAKRESGEDDDAAAVEPGAGGDMVVVLRW